MKKRNLIALCLILFPTLSLVAQEWETSGSLRNFAVASETLFEEDYFLFIHRLRNQFLFRPDGGSEFRLELDNQGSWGSYLDTRQKLLLDGLQKENYFDLSLMPIDEQYVQWRTRVHRLSYRLTEEDFDFSVGRQRIAWGTARIWSPGDLFNQVSPTAIEVGEIPGADSVHLAIRTDDDTQFELAGSIGTDSEDTRWGVKAKRSISSYDVSLLVGQTGEQKVLGFDFTGYLGDAGLRGEAVWFSDDYRDYIQAVMSYEYVFPNSVSLLVEYLYNGGNLENFSLSNLQSYEKYSSITTVNKHFIGIRSGGQIDQLLSAGVVCILDLEGESSFLYPNLVYNWKQNIDVMAGVQLFYGDQGEYSHNKHAGVMMLTWYF